MLRCCVHVSILSDVTHHEVELPRGLLFLRLSWKKPKYSRNIFNFIKGRWELKLSEQRPSIEFHQGF